MSLPLSLSSYRFPPGSFVCVFHSLSFCWKRPHHQIHRALIPILRLHSSGAKITIRYRRMDPISSMDPTSCYRTDYYNSSFIVVDSRVITMIPKPSSTQLKVSDSAFVDHSILDCFNSPCLKDNSKSMSLAFSTGKRVCLILPCLSLLCCLVAGPVLGNPEAYSSGNQLPPSLIHWLPVSVTYIVRPNILRVLLAFLSPSSVSPRCFSPAGICMIITLLRKTGTFSWLQPPN